MPEVLGETSRPAGRCRAPPYAGTGVGPLRHPAGRRRRVDRVRGGRHLAADLVRGLVGRPARSRWTSRQTPTLPTRKILRSELGADGLARRPRADDHDLRRASASNLMTIKVTAGHRSRSTARDARRARGAADPARRRARRTRPSSATSCSPTSTSSSRSSTRTCTPASWPLGVLPVTPAPPVAAVPAGHAEPDLDQERRGVGAAVATDHAHGRPLDSAPFDDSMAAAIEDEMNKLLSADCKDRCRPTTRRRGARPPALVRGDRARRDRPPHGAPRGARGGLHRRPEPHATGDFQAQVQVSAADVP